MGTTSTLLRLAFVCEFLVALVAIFTAWSEIGGQAVLDSMHWAWKFGLSMLLAGAIVGYSAAISFEERIWNARSARWLTGIVLVILAMGVVTFYFELQGGDNSDTDETSSAISRLRFAEVLSASS